MLAEMDQNLTEHQRRHEEAVKVAFGQRLTFAEYLKEDKEYLAEKSKKL